MDVNAVLVLPGNSRYGPVLGKNSNAAGGNVYELIYERSSEENAGDLKCTHITIPGADKQYGVILSKPTALWGCEMGANDQDVVGAILRNNNDSEKGLLPQDILRLCLERSSSLENVLEVLDTLLTNHENEGVEATFIFVDKNSAFYVETAGKAWVAQILSEGVHFLPLSEPIVDNYDKFASELEVLAKNKGWNGEGKVPWNEIFGSEKRCADEKRKALESSLLSTYLTDTENFSVEKMTRILRDTENRISRGSSDVTPTIASQVSILPKSAPSCHWFTATPDPTLSVFKPFIFTPNARIGNYTVSSEGQHSLYALHSSTTSNGENKVLNLLREMEKNCFNEVDTFLFDKNPDQSLSEVDDLFKDCVEAEMKFYR